MEKWHSNTKAIKQLQLENSSVIKTDEENLTEQKSFYQNLYALRSPDISVHDDFFLLRRIYCKLDQHAQEGCEGPLTKEECLSSLKTMASDKTPGTDALPEEFYEVFWEDIDGYLLNALNGPYEKR